MLTDDDIKALRRELGDGFRDFTNEEWRQFKALLQHRSKGADDPKVLKRPLGVIFVAIMKMKQWETDLGLPPSSDLRDGALRMIAVAANYYWKNSANPTPTRNIRGQLEKVIKKYRRDGEALSKLTPDYVEERFLTTVIIDSLEKKRRDLQDARVYESAAFHRSEFVFNLLLIWVACGGNLGSSHQDDKPSGPLIRYLMFACRLVMGEGVRAAETLQADIDDFKKMDSKMWKPALRRPKRK